MGLARVRRHSGLAVLEVEERNAGSPSNAPLAEVKEGPERRAERPGALPIPAPAKANGSLARVAA